MHEIVNFHLMCNFSFTCYFLSVHVVLLVHVHLCVIDPVFYDLIHWCCRIAVVKCILSSLFWFITNVASTNSCIHRMRLELCNYWLSIHSCHHVLLPDLLQLSISV